MNKYTTVEYRGINFEVTFHAEDKDDEYLMWEIFIEGTEVDLLDIFNFLIDRSSKMCVANEIEILARAKLGYQI